MTAADAANAMLAAASGGAGVAVVTAVSPDGTAHRVLVHEYGGTSGVVPDDAVSAAAEERARTLLHTSDAAPEGIAMDGAAGEWLVLVEVQRARERLLIVGAGHIAVPLARLGTLLDFDVVVLDDREEWATPERFPDDVAVHRADFGADPFAQVELTPRTYVALVTRGHRWDFDCLQRLLALDVQPCYIGMIGSRRRVRAAFTALLQAGVPREVLARIRAPIGLELQAETPAEIAVSIAAELVAVRRGAEAGSISERERVLDRFLGSVDAG